MREFTWFRRVLLVLPLLGLLMMPFAQIGCTDAEDITAPEEEGFAAIVVPDDFDYETQKSIRAYISVKDALGNSKKGVIITFYYELEEGNPESWQQLARGITQYDGECIMQLIVPTYMEEVLVKAHIIGIDNIARIPLTSANVRYDFGGTLGAMSAPVRGPVVKSTLTRDYTFMGNGEFDWSNLGRPYYLMDAQDTFSAEFFDNVTNMLPEAVNINTHHPEYILQQTEARLQLLEDAHVTISYVHENAGYLNAMGFYTYPGENIPANQDAVDPLTVVFPNCSFPNSGGEMQTGDKVDLGDFDAGTTMSFFAVADGWLQAQHTVGDGRWLVMSDDALNDSDMRQAILLQDQYRHFLILGFEDILRDRGGDNDFNDAIFCVKVEPWSAVDTTGLPPLDVPDEDRDGDDVPDVVDEYPDDPDKAFNNYFDGVVAFEDLWPIQGDYDFNDLVMAYEINQITNGENLITQIEADWTIKAVGADYDNGFAFELPISPGWIASVSGSDCQGTVFTGFSGSAPEIGPDLAVIPVFDRTDQIITPINRFVNTDPSDPVQVAPTTEIVITFTNGLPQDSLSAPPYNPFIVVNGLRTHEVHLAGQAPTSMMNMTYFGTEDDASDVGAGEYYVTSSNLPWGLEVPEDWKHMYSGVDITEGYLYFEDWAESGGTVYMDWYQDRPGYTDDSVIFDGD